MFAGNRKKTLGVAVQLFLGVRQMHHGHEAEHHPLIPVGQVAQHFLGFRPLLLNVIGQHGSEVVCGILTALPVCGIGLHTQQLVLHFPHRLVGGHRQDINGQHQVPVQLAEFRHHAVFDVAGVSLQIEHPAPAVIQLEVIRLELHGVRAQPILEAMAQLHLSFKVELEGGRLCSLEEIPEDPQTGHQIQFLPNGGQLGQMGDQVSADPRKVCTGFRNVFLDHADCDVSLLHHTIAGPGDLGEQHIVVLLAEVVQSILAHGKQQGRFELRLVKPPVIDGDLGAGAGVQCVEQFGIVQEHSRLVFLAGDLVVDVGERERLGELSPHLEDPVRPDAADGDGILHRAGNAELVPFRLGCFAESLNDRHPPFLVSEPELFLQPVP